MLKTRATSEDEPKLANWSERKRAEEFAKLKSFRKGRNAPNCFETELRHGDYIVMHGSNLQKYFEHQISNLGDIRYALTGRHVRPEECSEDERLGGIYETSPEDVYSGDMDAFTDLQN